MARKNRVNDLGHHRIVIPDDAWKYRGVPILPQAGDQIFPDFVFDPSSTQTLFGEVAAAQFAQRARNTHERNPQILQWFDYTPAVTVVSLVSEALKLRNPRATRPISTFRRANALLLFIFLLALALRAMELPQSAGLPGPGVIADVVCASDTTQSYALYLPSGYVPGKNWPIIYFF